MVDRSFDQKMEKYDGYGLGKLTMTRVSVLLYPRVLTTVGKNELKPQAALRISIPVRLSAKSTHHVQGLEQHEECELGIGESLLETSDRSTRLL